MTILSVYFSGNAMMSLLAQRRSFIYVHTIPYSTRNLRDNNDYDDDDDDDLKRREKKKYSATKDAEKEERLRVARS